MVTGTFTKKMHLHVLRIWYRISWRRYVSNRFLSPPTVLIPPPSFWLFKKLIPLLEGIQLMEDSDDTTDVDYERLLCTLFREVQETMGEVCEVLREVLSRALRPSKLFFFKPITGLEIFRTHLVRLKSKQQRWTIGYHSFMQKTREDTVRNLSLIHI